MNVKKKKKRRNIYFFVSLLLYNTCVLKKFVCFDYYEVKISISENISIYLSQDYIIEYKL